MSNGDPQTPNWPSLQEVHKVSGENLTDSLPKIPVQSIGYEDAKMIMEYLGGNDLSSNDYQGWTGGLGIDYKLGGSPMKDSLRLHLRVNRGICFHVLFGCHVLFLFVKSFKRMTFFSSLIMAPLILIPLLAIALLASLFDDKILFFEIKSRIFIPFSISLDLILISGKCQPGGEVSILGGSFRPCLLYTDVPGRS